MDERGIQPWRRALKDNMDCLRYLYTSGRYSDLDVIFPKEGVCIKAHRLILSMKSPVIGAMLTGPLAASKELILPEDPVEIFRKLLDQAYLDQMELKTVEEALKVYALAHKYMMVYAKQICQQYILSNLREDMMLAALETSVLLGDKELNNKCKEMLSRDPDTVMSPETVSHLRKETLRDLLKDDGLQFSSEAVIFKGLIAWGKAQLGQEEELSGSAVHEKIGDLLKEVQSLNMSYDEFAENMFKHEDSPELLPHPEDDQGHQPLDPSRGHSSESYQGRQVPKAQEEGGASSL